MKDDPTIKAVREARHRISEAVGHDPQKLVDYYCQLQERHRERIVPQPKQEAQAEGEDAA